MKKSVTAGILAIGFLFLWMALSCPLRAAAKEKIIMEARPRVMTAYEGQQVEIVLSLKKLPRAAACFDLQVESDRKRFTLKKVTPLGEIATGELHYNTVGATTYLVYYDKEGGQSPIRAEGDVAVLTFMVNEGAVAGQTPFSFQCAVVGDQTAANMGMASTRCSVQVTPPPSGNALLAGLTPGTGRLVPGFSSECFSYSLEVGENVDRLTFRYRTMHPSATAKVNRETLNGKGKSTRMIVTVTAADRSTQKYIITVLRRKGGTALTAPEEQVIQQETAPHQAAAEQEEMMLENRVPLLTRTLSRDWALGAAGLFLITPFLFLLFRRILRKKDAM